MIILTDDPVVTLHGWHQDEQPIVRWEVTSYAPAASINPWGESRVTGWDESPRFGHWFTWTELADRLPVWPA